VQVGLLVNVNNFTVDPGRLGEAVEAAGFESLWVGDHPAIPYETDAEMHQVGGEIPEAYAHVADPFVALAMAAARTSTLKLGTGIAIVSARPPVITALQASTLDFFSGGRLLFGVGAGWLEGELTVLGADYPNRLAQTRDHVEAMRALWATPERAHDGRWASFPRLKLNPRPAQEGGPKVHLGTWGERAPARVAAWADAWLPMLVTPEDLKAALAQLEVECEKVGRDAAEIEITLFEYDAGGDRAASQDFLAGYAEAGADRVVVISGMGDSMGSDDWGAWTPEGYEDQLADVARRYL
jgi:probable F420-dependent oxidoreductase